ncbi:hypothetical protein C0Q64_20765 [Streptomyces albidoflavus]|nr:hypothetical protein C0Q64_20765 [Streptomyces albidoflavus]RZD99971.1 hypothetical protein C0Q65_21000 [Streptomyces albidoflavus]
MPSDGAHPLWARPPEGPAHPCPPDATPGGRARLAAPRDGDRRREQNSGHPETGPVASWCGARSCPRRRSPRRR